MKNRNIYKISAFEPRVKAHSQIGKYLSLLFLTITFISCSDFIEVDPPKNLLVSQTVFEDPATVESALANIFFKMREQGMVSGNFGVTASLGTYSDELQYYGFDPSYNEFYNHTITAANGTLLTWWTNAYNLIYAANDIIVGVDNSTSLTGEDADVFKGQALFVRAYLHSLMVPLFGDIPYVTTTNYLENNTVSRLLTSTVYDNILNDLNQAIVLLENTEIIGERVLPYKTAAQALLSRMYLYTENWNMAATTASELINNAYTLEPDLNKVFLNDSPETIWQLKSGETPRNTQIANLLIIQFIPGQQYALTNSLMDAFESDDLRQSSWTGSMTNTDGTTTLHFAYKYKATLAVTEVLEYEIVFRLAEQFLIRAEAQAHLGNISQAQQDVNEIRNRAGLPNTTASSTNELLEVILKERQLELFTEHGHRWYDLVRTGNVGNVISPIKPNWNTTNVLLPIPESELELNPNLLPQNPGY